ncbi:MAG: hypothetical protein ABFD82_07420, partial [Syntrophaceae bacterium]
SSQFNIFFLGVIRKQRSSQPSIINKLANNKYCRVKKMAFQAANLLKLYAILTSPSSIFTFSRPRKM